jgi:hypothetical protein
MSSLAVRENDSTLNQYAKIHGAEFDITTCPKQKAMSDQQNNDQHVDVCEMCLSVILDEPRDCDIHRRRHWSVPRRASAGGRASSSVDDSKGRDDDDETDSAEIGSDSEDDRHSLWAEHHPTIEDLGRSAKTCPLCVVLLASYLSFATHTRNVIPYHVSSAPGPRLLKFTTSSCLGTASWKSR